ncbi:hypothetical protein EMPS_10229 [Entomortierella parvispora]|uniref:Uncharacterized protein n=1 Tax=Entomortierella parvispora TaxID=205924 RepID=A0A9P3HJS3_9FUNG|nr:hypothetical protein EMPS_10229 [Entomortierella parvispora]
MINHRTKAPFIILDDHDKSIWLQVKRSNGRACCSFGDTEIPFEGIMMNHNEWRMYLLAPKRGAVHVFHDVLMIHKSREDALADVLVEEPDALLLYDNCSKISGRFFYDPVSFLTSSCDLGLGKGTDHIQVHLHYPAAAANSVLQAHTEEEDLTLLLNTLSISSM